MVCGEFIITNCLEYQAFLFVVNGTAVSTYVCFNGLIRQYFPKDMGFADDAAVPWILPWIHGLPTPWIWIAMDF